MKAILKRQMFLLFIFYVILSYYNGDYVSVCNQNYVTTNGTIFLVNYITFAIVLFLSKPQLRKLSYIINTVGLIYI